VDLTQKILEIADKYAKDVQVLSIYVRETHPSDGWEFPGNSVCYLRPTTLEERANIANDFIVREKASGIDLWLDQMDNSAALLYKAEPERLYIIREEKIVYVGGPGPFEYDPWQVEKWLIKELGY